MMSIIYYKHRVLLSVLFEQSISCACSYFCSQVLAANVTPENRAACAQTTKPLIDAVEALVTFVSSPQFASTPAKISAQARQAQEPIINVSIHMCMYDRKGTGSEKEKKYMCTVYVPG